MNVKCTTIWSSPGFMVLCCYLVESRLHSVLYHYLVDSRLHGILYCYLVDFQASQYLVKLFSSRFPGFTACVYDIPLSGRFQASWCLCTAIWSFSRLHNNLLGIQLFSGRFLGFIALNLGYITIWSISGLMVFWRYQDIIRSSPGFIT